MRVARTSALWMDVLDRGDEMRALSGQNDLNTVARIAAPEAQGLAGWLVGLLRAFRGKREMQRKQLRLVESLSLGGKRQLMLVSCGGESFLVGGGMDSVETIVRVKADGLDGTC